MRQADLFQTSFCFLKKLYIRYNLVACILVSIYFDSHQLKETKNKTNKLIKI